MKHGFFILQKIMRFQKFGNSPAFLKQLQQFLRRPLHVVKIKFRPVAGAEQDALLNPAAGIDLLDQLELFLFRQR